MKQRLVDWDIHGISGEMGLQTSGMPRISPLHQALKARVLQKAVQPLTQRLQSWIRIKSFRIGNSPLAYKRPEGPIGKRTARIHKPATLVFDPLRPVPEHQQPLVLMLSS